MIAFLIYKANTTDKSTKSIKAFFPLPSDVDESEDDSPKMSSEQFERTLKLYGVKK